MKRSFQVLIMDFYYSFSNAANSWLRTQLPNFYSGFDNLKIGLTRTFSSNHDRLGSDEIRYFVVSNKKLWIGIFLSILMLLILILVMRPYVIKVHERLSLNQSQSEILKKLIIESQSLSSKKNIVPVFLDQDLAKLKQLLLSKGMKPNQLTFNSTNNVTIDLQLNQVSYAPFIDLVNEFREIWNIYPVQVSVEASTSPGIVNIKTKLVQFRDIQTNSPDLVLN